ncbi:MAG: prenyltransferase/squalene oxidase repeat-containing protein [Planctomycetaceae bacterium]
MKHLIPAIASVLVFIPAPLPAAEPTEQQREIDQAIVRALEFLAEEQQPSGAWRIDSYGESTAGASLSVMAFMAAGHVPGEGPYGEAIDRGIRYVLEHQEANGMLVDDRSSHGPMYEHGISTLMLAEAVGMLGRDKSRAAREALEDAVRLILAAQNIPKPARHEGGWRYHPTSRDSDLSVTGWQLLALRAAKNVGCDVPAEHIDRAVEYVKNCAVRDHRGFAYQPGSGPTATRTGTGILALEICGEHHTPEALGGADFLLAQPLQWSDHYFFYGAYYCSVGMFQVGGDHWEHTRDHVAKILLEHQQPDGSWIATSGSERSSGKVYATAMAVLALSVEYRYLPIYQR